MEAGGGRRRGGLAPRGRDVRRSAEGRLGASAVRYGRRRYGETGKVITLYLVQSSLNSFPKPIDLGGAKQAGGYEGPTIVDRPTRHVAAKNTIAISPETYC